MPLLRASFTRLKWNWFTGTGSGPGMKPKERFLNMWRCITIANGLIQRSDFLALLNTRGGLSNERAINIFTQFTKRKKKGSEKRKRKYDYYFFLTKRPLNWGRSICLLNWSEESEHVLEAGFG